MVSHPFIALRPLSLRTLNIYSKPGRFSRLRISILHRVARGTCEEILLGLVLVSPVVCLIFWLFRPVLMAI